MRIPETGLTALRAKAIPHVQTRTCFCTNISVVCFPFRTSKRIIYWQSNAVSYTGRFTFGSPHDFRRYFFTTIPMFHLSSLQRDYTNFRLICC